MISIDPVLFTLMLQASKTSTSTVPTWLALTTVLAAPIVSVVVTYLTLSKTNARERERLAHEEKIKGKELELSRLDEERKDRMQVYRAMAKATRNPEEFDGAPESRDLYEALSEIELISGSPELRKAAAELVKATAHARETVYKYDQLRTARGGVAIPEEEEARNNAVERALRLRERFIEEARSEITLSEITL